MLIWLITVGEPLPIDGDNARLYRTGIFSDLLVAKRHKVVWWTSTFDHVRKKQRFSTDREIRLNDHIHLKLLHSISYKKNISLRRIINHIGIASKFKKQAKTAAIPDIIVCSFPTIELSLAAARYGKENGIPVILDIRDLWPDLFIDFVADRLKPIARLMLFPMLKSTRNACRLATAIIGITPEYVNWGLEYAGRPASKLDRDFPFGYSEMVPSAKSVSRAEDFWRKFGIEKSDKIFTICFFGTIGHQFDLETIIDAAYKLKSNHPSFRFVLCGNGDKLPYYMESAKHAENVIFPGWVGHAEIWTLMRMSSMGLAPYINSENFESNLPNKPIEYLSAGLPIFSCLRGVLANLIATHDCGVTYQNRKADDVVSKLLYLLDNPDRLKKMSENATNLYKKRFVAETVYSNMADYLQKIVNEKIAC